MSQASPPLSCLRLGGSGWSGPTPRLKSKHSQSSPSQARVMPQPVMSQASPFLSCLRLGGAGWSCPTPRLTVEALPVKPQSSPSQAPVMGHLGEGGLCLAFAARYQPIEGGRSVWWYIAHTNRRNQGLISVDRRASLLSHLQYPVLI